MPANKEFFKFLDVRFESKLSDMSGDFLQWFLREGRKHNVWLPPAWLVEFIVAFAELGNYSDILDPWSIIGLLARELVTATYPQRAVAILPDSDIASAVVNAPRSVGIDWRIGSPLEQLDTVDGNFSLIASAPPMNVSAAPLELLDWNNLQIRDSLGHQVLLKSCLKLTEDGVGLFVVPPNFTTRYGPTAYRQLSRFGLYLNAALSIPAGSFSPYTEIPGLLVFISRQDHGKLFIGELADSTEHNDVLLENMLSHQVGAKPSLGALVNLSDFTTYAAYSNQLEIDKLAEAAGLKTVPLRVAALDIKLIKGKDAGGFDDRTNAVYLPLIGNGDAVASRDRLRIKAHNYAQIVLDPEVSLAPYVAGFFNSPLGLLVREVNTVGVTIPKITKSRLQDSTIYLPDIHAQGNAVITDERIRNQLSELEELREKLWRSPSDLEQVREDLTMLGLETEDERFLRWIDSLPFPLASILWTYQASGGDHKARYERLFHFFEALAAFHATILLSAYVDNPAVFEEVKGKLDRSIKTLPNSSFGTWFHFTRLLAKDARKRQEIEMLLKEMLRTNDDSVLNMLISPQISNLLQQVNDLRNLWLGHTGYVSPREAEVRHAALKLHLASLQREIGTRWRRYRLIKPGLSEYGSGVHSYQVEIIMGRSTPFITEENVETTILLEKNALYMLSPGEERPLELLPLVKIMPPPSSAENACYFYNRLNDDGSARYVAYHFANEAEIKVDFNEADRTIAPIFPGLFEE